MLIPDTVIAHAQTTFTTTFTITRTTDLACFLCSKKQLLSLFFLKQQQEGRVSLSYFKMKHFSRLFKPWSWVCTSHFRLPSVITSNLNLYSFRICFFKYLTTYIILFYSNLFLPSSLRFHSQLQIQFFKSFYL